MTQQTHISTSQTIKSVKPVRQSRGPPFSLKTEESLKNYYLAEFFKNLDQFQKLNIRKCDIYGERGHSKVPPDSDDEKNDGDGYDEDNNRWTEYDPPMAEVSNSKHITESLGWFTDVSISIKDKDGKTVIVTGNFTCINNGEPKLILCLAFNKASEVKDLPKVDQNQVFTNSSNPTNKIFAERRSQLKEKRSDK
ncbi:hypothetical protein GLOIN_2v1705062 [Rhizophagus clarus]|uniref:Uncharacterized protein n=1 Tax=Rhizophagus clarus TaxID=94130 RepID=A0A8H3QSP8_9GLOM|nr:hypothetical protein GLOIN_2v1705062 [Rhizophagus clarus]